MLQKRRDGETEDSFQSRQWQWWADYYHCRFEAALSRLKRDAPYTGGAMLDYEDAVKWLAMAFRQQFAFRHGYDPLDT